MLAQVRAAENHLLGVSPQPLHDAGHDLWTLRLVERFVAQARQHSSLHAGQLSQRVAPGGWNERVRAAVDHESWNAELIERRMATPWPSPK